MLAFSAVVAGAYSLGALAANEVDAVAMNAVRFAMAGALLLGVAMQTGGVPRTALRAPWRYGLIGAAVAIYFVLMFEGLKTASPVSMSAIFTLSPIMSGFFGFVLLRQITTRRMALALAVGGLGALWVIFQADLSRFLQFQIGHGEMVFFWGTACFALYTPLSRLLNRGESPLVFAFLCTAGAVVLLTLWGWRGLVSTDWLALRPLVWGVILYLAIAASALTFVLLQIATLRLPSAKVMAYTYLIPSWVIGWEAALGRSLPPIDVAVGVGLTVVALMLLLKDEAPVESRA